MALPFATDDGIGARATLGLILLQADETLENEARELLPTAGVALHHSRIVMPPVVSHETLAGMTATLPVAAQMLPQADFDVIGYGCTSGATVIGPAGVAAAINRVHPAAKVTDPMSAVVAACRVRGLKRLGFVTPYVAEVSAAMRGFLRDAGFEIGAFGSFEQGDDRVVARIAPASVLAAIEHVGGRTDCDGVFVSCTNLRTAGIAAAAARRIGKPVISSNLALLWHMLDLAGVPFAPLGDDTFFAAAPAR